jgi:acyl transferase domain-containing protein
MSAPGAAGASRSPAIAVIGMAGRFPGAADLDAFWANLCAGVESIRFFGDDELAAAGVPRRLLARPDYVKAGSVLDGIELFDAPFFGYSPREAELIDPQQRLFLESAWRALEDAGHDPARFDGAIGVCAGASLSGYLIQLASMREVVETFGARQLYVGNSGDFLATRVAYKLGLTGPAYAVQSACSTSLVAVHLACEALLDYDADLMLAGGVSVRVPQVTGYLFEQSGINSPDGHTRPFDAAAGGTVFGSGVGVVALRRLEDALADGDTVHAVILGSAVNNDGAHKVGFTAPSLTAQTEVVVEALAAAGVEPDTVGYVEGHGTATELGDPIEVEALTRAFAEGTSHRGFCGLGSVKSNIGHLDAAAGISGLIKTVLALRHRCIPPSLNYQRPNPEIDFAASPFRVVDRLESWERGDTPRRAGVSSFGFGGTNAHVVVEEAPAPAARAASRSAHLVVLSARTPPALEVLTAALAGRLEADPSLDLGAAAATLQRGRRAFEHRAAMVCSDRSEAVAALRSGDPRLLAVGRCRRVGTPVAFLLSGQGAQHPGMARGLYDSEPVFQREIDRAAEALAGRPALGGRDLRELLWPAGGEDPEEAAARLRATEVAQPALFAVEHALARLWTAWGVEPAAMRGHSLGEWTAACLAGVFGFEDALELVAERGRLMAGCEPGTMLAVELTEDEVSGWLLGGLELAAVNAPAACVIAGPQAAVAGLEVQLGEVGVGCRRLHTSHAFHTASMAPAAEALAARLARVELRPPEIPFVSCLTGDWIEPERATDPGYWAAQLRRPVRFADGLAALAAEPHRALLEVGPGGALRAPRGLNRVTRRSRAIPSSSDVNIRLTSSRAYTVRRPVSDTPQVRPSV